MARRPSHSSPSSPGGGGAVRKPPGCPTQAQGLWLGVHPWSIKASRKCPGPCAKTAGRVHECCGAVHSQGPLYTGRGPMENVSSTRMKMSCV